MKRTVAIGAIPIVLALGLATKPHAARGSVSFGLGLALSADQSKALVADEGSASVLVFVRRGSAWKQQARLSSGEEPDDTAFSRPLALSADGKTAVFGARRVRRSTIAALQHVWVFVRSGSRWKQQAEIRAPADDKLFGSSVALSGDGHTMLVGDWSDRGETGAVWVFTRSGSHWVRQGPKLTPRGAKGSSHFGDALSLSRDGNTALIGASYDSSDAGLFQQSAGAAYVFTRSGVRWSQGAKLVGQAGVIRYFGSTVALSADGDRALIASGGAVAAWAFARTGSTWAPESPSMLTPSHGIGRSDWLGRLSLAPDGNSALLSGYFSSGSGGTVRLYRRTAVGWEQTSSALTSTPLGEGVVWFVGASR